MSESVAYQPAQNFRIWFLQAPGYRTQASSAKLLKSTRVEHEEVDFIDALEY